MVCWERLFFNCVILYLSVTSSQCEQKVISVHGVEKRSIQEIQHELDEGRRMRQATAEEKKMMEHTQKVIAENTKSSKEEQSQSKLGSLMGIASSRDITSVVVSYQDEMDMLKLHLQGSCKFMGYFASEILVIWNDNYSDGTDQEIKGSCNCNCRIVYRDHTPAKNLHQNGWLVQQYLKLFASTIVTTKYYIVHDTKNVPLRNIYVEDYFIDSSPKRMGCQPFSSMSSSDQGYYSKTLRAMHLTLPSNDVAPTSTTPFLMITQYVRDMMHNSNLDIVNKILADEATEFCSSYLYETLMRNNRNGVCVGDKDISLTVWENSSDEMKNQILSNPEQFMRENPKIKYFALHRYSVNKNDQRYQNCFEFFKRVMRDEVVL